MPLFDLTRFTKAQKCYYATALEEIACGRKKSHWIWYIFPQLRGVGYSSTAREFSLDGREEAEAYMADPELRERMVEISTALLNCGKEDISEIFGYPDENNVRACMTLFREICPEEKVFDSVLQKFFSGEADEKTMDILNGGHI